MDGPEVDALVAQVTSLTDLVDELTDEEFRLATRCPGWSVAELVAHCEGMLVRLVGENAQPVKGEAQIDRVGYYRYDPDGPREGEGAEKTFSEIIRDRVVDEVGGRSAVELTNSLHAAVDGTWDGVGDIPADRVIKRSGHPRMTFEEFLASRSLEFGVHTMDIAHAVGQPETVEPLAGTIITGILDGLLGQRLPDTLRWDETTYILSATGRRPLEPGERAALGHLAPSFPLLR